MSVPDTTTVPERPWYPIGRCFQFGVNGLSPDGRSDRHWWRGAHWRRSRHSRRQRGHLHLDVGEGIRCCSIVGRSSPSPTRSAARFVRWSTTLAPGQGKALSEGVAHASAKGASGTEQHRARSCRGAHRRGCGPMGEDAVGQVLDSEGITGGQVRAWWSSNTSWAMVGREQSESDELGDRVGHLAAAETHEVSPDRLRVLGIVGHPGEASARFSPSRSPRCRPTLCSRRRPRHAGPPSGR